MEIGIKVIDIKEKSISTMVDQIVNLDKVSPSIVSIDIINLPPTQLHANLVDEQYFENGKVITKTKLSTTLDNSDAQLIITTEFPVLKEEINNALINAIVWTIFYVFFSSTICLLFYYRFSLPKFNYQEDIKRKIEQNLNNLH